MMATLNNIKNGTVTIELVFVLLCIPQSGLGIDTQKGKEISIFDSSPKSKETTDFDGSLKK